MAKPVGIAEWTLALFRTFSMTPIITRFTDLVAFLAVFAWVDPNIMVWLQESSTLAALVTPIFALIWLITQIAIRIAEFFRDKEDDKDEE